MKKWLEIIFDHRIDLQERMFRVVTGISMVAMAFVMPMGRTVWNYLALAASLVIMAWIVKVSIKKGSSQRRSYRHCGIAAGAFSYRLFHGRWVL